MDSVVNSYLWTFYFSLTPYFHSQETVYRNANYSINGKVFWPAYKLKMEVWIVLPEECRPLFQINPRTCSLSLISLTIFINSDKIVSVLHMQWRWYPLSSLHKTHCLLCFKKALFLYSWSRQTRCLWLLYDIIQIQTKGLGVLTLLYMKYWLQYNKSWYRGTRTSEPMFWFVV